MGVMSGSSLDGIDLAIVDFKPNSHKWTWTLLAQQTVALRDSLKTKLAHIVNLSAFGIAQTNAEYSTFIASSINTFLDASEINTEVLGIHGHTVLHLPDYPASWQLLNGGLIAELAGLPVVCDFRNQDMALGGQGTPMAVLCDKDLFPGYDAYINLGGIANISYSDHDKWVGYDIAGCNQLLNHFSAKKGLEYDKDGQMAQAGKAIPNMLHLLDSDPYLQKATPKSLDNTYLKELITKLDEIDCPTEDALFTIVEFITKQLVKEIKESSAKSVLFSGGGTKNKFLIDKLRTKLGEDINVVIPDDTIIEYKESILIAYAALLRWQGLPNFVSSATGGQYDTIGGALYLPSNKSHNV